MKSYVIHDISGNILRAGNSDDDYNDIRDPNNEFELLTPLPFDIENYKVSNGALVMRDEQDLDQEKHDLEMLLFKRTRNTLLAASDWTQTPDSPLSNSKKQEWATYRQALRDLPANTADPSNPSWPTQP